MRQKHTCELAVCVHTHWQIYATAFGSQQRERTVLRCVIVCLNCFSHLLPFDLLLPPFAYRYTVCVHVCVFRLFIQLQSTPRSRRPPPAARSLLTRQRRCAAADQQRRHRGHRHRPGAQSAGRIAVVALAGAHLLAAAEAAALVALVLVVGVVPAAAANDARIGGHYLEHRPEINTQSNIITVHAIWRSSAIAGRVSHTVSREMLGIISRNCGEIFGNATTR